jgi:hypothetical protein
MSTSMCVERRESFSTRKLVHAQRAGKTPRKGAAQAHTPPGTHAPNPGARSSPGSVTQMLKVCVGILAPHTPTPKGCEEIY